MAINNVFSAVNAAVKNVAGKVTDVVEDIADDAKEVITGKKDQKQASSAHASKDVWERRAADDDSFGDIMRSGLQKMARGAKEIVDGVDTIRDTAISTGKKAVHKAGRDFMSGVEHAARPFIDTHKRLQEDVQQTIDILKDADPKELLEKGWESVGLSKSERQEIKESFEKAYDGISEAIDDSVQYLADRGDVIIRDTIEDVLRTHSEFEEIFDQITPSKDEIEAIIKQQIANGSDEVKEVIDVLEQGALLGVDLGSELVERMTTPEAIKGLVEMFILSTPLQPIAMSVCQGIKMLEVASTIPSLAQDIMNDPRSLEGPLIMLRPELGVQKAKELKPGESFQLQVGTEVNAAFKGKLGGELNVKRLDNGHLSVSFKSAAAIGVKKGGIDLEGQKAVVFELELSNDQDLAKLLTFVQSTMLLGAASTSPMLMGINPMAFLSGQDMDGEIKIKSLSLPGVGSAELKGELSAEGKMKLSAGGKIALGHDHGYESTNDGGHAMFSKINLSLDASIALKPDNIIELNLPDDVATRANGLGSLMNHALQTCDAKNAELFFKCIQSGDLGVEAKVSVAQEMKLRASDDGNIQLSATTTLKGMVGTNEVALEMSITVTDAVKLAEALGKSVGELEEMYANGQLDLGQIASQFKQLVPDPIELTSKVTATTSDKTGIALSQENVGASSVSLSNTKSVTLAQTDKSGKMTTPVSWETVREDLLTLQNYRLGIKEKPVSQSVAETFGVILRP